MDLKGQNVLVTGACGFIGSHLVEALINEECHVKAMTFYNPLNSWGWIDSLPKEKVEKIEVLTGDIRNQDSLKKMMKNVDVVFHLAALVGIPYSYISPESYLATNVHGTLNILQTAQELNVQKIIVLSTSEVYGTAQSVPMNEDHPLHAQSPYAASKIAADMLAESFYRSFNLPVIIARPFNTFGPRQSARAIIPSIITQLLSPLETIKIGNLHPTRDFNYVEDVCNGLIEIAKHDHCICRIINISSNHEISMSSLINLISDIMNIKKPIDIEPERQRPPKSEVARLWGDNSLLLKLTNWKPQYGLKEGLIKTINWYRSEHHLKLFKPNLYNI